MNAEELERSRARDRARYANRPDGWRRTEQDRSRERIRNLTDEQRQRRRSTARARYAANPEKYRADLRARYAAGDPAKHLERSRAYRARMPDDVKQRQRAYIRAYGNAQREEIIGRLWREQDGYCYLCDERVLLSEAIRDHDHRCCPKASSACGKCWRGAVHNSCNSLIGLAGDDPDRLELIARNLRRKLAEISPVIDSKPVQLTLPALTAGSNGHH